MQALTCRRLRLAVGLTRSELARRLGISADRLGQIESGSCQITDLQAARLSGLFVELSQDKQRAAALCEYARLRELSEPKRNF